MWRGRDVRASRGRNVGDGRGRSAASARARGIPMIRAPPIRRGRRSRRVGRRARRRRRTRHAERSSAPSAARPTEIKRVREGADGTICGPKRDARARVRTVIFEVATGKGRVVRGSLLAAHHGLHRALVSPAERAKTAPAFPAPAPNWFPGAEGIPLRGRKALFRKRGAVLGAREPHVVGRFDGSQTLDRRKPRRRRDDTKVIQDERRPRKN